MIPIHDAAVPSTRQLAWPLLAALSLLALLWLSPYALADEEYDEEYVEYEYVSEDAYGEYSEEFGGGYEPEITYENAPAEVIAYADPAVEQAQQIDEEQAAKERAAAEAALKKRTDKLMAYLKKHHDAIEAAHVAAETARQQAEASEKAMKKAAAKVKKQEKRINKLRTSFKKLSATDAKNKKAGGTLDKALGTGSLDELRALLGSSESLSEEQAALLGEIRRAYGELQPLRRKLDETAAQAEADKVPFEEAKAESDKVDAKAAKRIGAVMNDVADDGARRALGDSVAKSIFPDKQQLVCPCPNTRVEDWFGYRDFDAAVHKGIDYAANDGQAYYATADGVVIYATDDDGYNGGAGNWIVIAHGDGVVSKYMHSQRVFVKVGDIVLQGQHIANAGQTGAAYGPHLHFQVEVDGEAVDPVPLME